MIDSDIEIPEMKEHISLRRSVSNKIIAGVCAGIADYLEINPNIIRVLFVFLFLLGGWGLVVYLGAVVVIPASNYEKEKSGSGKWRKNIILKFVISGFVLILLVYSALNYFWVHNFLVFSYLTQSLVFSIIIIGLGIFLIKFENKTKTFPSRNQNELHKSQSDIILTGVCGGLSEYLLIDSSITRIIWLTFTFATFGIGAVVYILLSYVMKKISVIVIEKE
ncbi:MAG: PspC domain-containing protein [Melioribacteraceae bacterium]|nr:PspC domain-containing protein [Melioribacteraceae bacterium]MCF8263567.1 PspC domain-containing protein [Melioribacteraceae bacterium]MCF8431238.1 PspC domain-containing protein [Melioribacteraceae bacterium]